MPVLPWVPVDGCPDLAFGERRPSLPGANDSTADSASA
jgi:hypothetical protein